MANPRKFSEKIAIHLQKQQEGDAAFEQIMKEVTIVTRGDGISHNNNNQLHINSSVATCRAESLPNVNQKYSIDLQSALHKLNEMQHGGNPMCEKRRVSPTRERHHRQAFDNKRIDSYSPYLFPPADSSYRRTHSDSALHQTSTTESAEAMRSSMQNVDALPSTGSSNCTYLLVNPSSITASEPNYYRSKSCGIPDIDVQDVTNAVYHNTPNTGSLPDLSNFRVSNQFAQNMEDQTAPQIMEAQSQVFPLDNSSNFDPSSNMYQECPSKAFNGKVYHVKDESVIAGNERQGFLSMSSGSFDTSEFFQDGPIDFEYFKDYM